MSPNELTEILTCGEISLIGRMPNSSNATFLAEVKHGEAQVRGIYKPLKGERPLWDFAPGLHRREVAAYKLSAHLGFDIVPVTVLRDGPYGEGSLQWFVEHDATEHYFTILENKPECHDQLRRICAFDIVANNTDRKSGHCLLAPEDKIWAIDHGVCFSAEFKLRTVMWEFGGEELPEEITTAIAPLADTVPLDVASLLDDDEVSALQERTQWLLDGGHFPIDRSGTRYPWPLV